MRHIEMSSDGCQRSDWSTAKSDVPQQKSTSQRTGSKSIRFLPLSTNGHSPTNVKTLKQKKCHSSNNQASVCSLVPYLLGGLLVGVLTGGLALAIVVSFWLTTPLSESTTTTIGPTATTTTTTTTSALPVRWNSTGTNVAGFTSGGGVSASQFHLPYSLALDLSNAIYVADRLNNRIQKWVIGGSSGTTVAGQANGTSGSALNYLNGPCDVLVDSSGTLYVADTENHRVLSYTFGTTVGTILAGTGTAGTALNQLNRPHGISRDAGTGTLYIAEYVNNRVMRYLSGATSGTIVAGGNGPGFSSTQLNGPIGVSFDSTSNSLLIANNDAHNVLRWVIGVGTWTLFAGSTNGTSGNTPTMFCNPTYVRLDSMSNVYVGDRCNHRIQYFAAGQSSGTTIAGSTSVSGSTTSLLNLPSAAVTDLQFNMYVADNINNRIQQFLHY